MGGRGASSGGRKLKDGTYLPYRSEYKSVYQSGNIKFLVPANGQVKAPLECDWNVIRVPPHYKQIESRRKANADR